MEVSDCITTVNLTAQCTHVVQIDFDVKQINQNYSEDIAITNIFAIKRNAIKMGTS